MSCPCRLTQEQLERHNKLDDDLRCTAKYADKSGNICGEPLGAHPREHQLQQSSAVQSYQQPSEHQYFIVTAQIMSSKKYSGYRRIMFQEAQNFRACYDIRNPGQSIWYPEGSDDLHVSLMFASHADAHDFIAQMATYSVYDKFRGGINFQKTMTIINVHNPNDCQFVLITDYDPTSSSSPTNSRDDSIHSSEITTYNGELDKGLRTVEDLSLLKYKEPMNACHIAPKAFYKEYKNDKNNFLYSTLLFHGYFDGDGKRPSKKAEPTWGVPPELALRFIEIGPTQTFNLKQYTMIIVHAEFREIEVARAMDGRWRDGSENIGELEVRTYFYTQNPTATVKYLKIKYWETSRRWRHCNCEEVDFTEKWVEEDENELKEGDEKLNENTDEVGEDGNESSDSDSS